MVAANKRLIPHQCLEFRRSFCTGFVDGINGIHELKGAHHVPGVCKRYRRLAFRHRTLDQAFHSSGGLQNGKLGMQMDVEKRAGFVR